MSNSSRCFRTLTLEIFIIDVKSVSVSHEIIFFAVLAVFGEWTRVQRKTLSLFSKRQQPRGPRGPRGPTEPRSDGVGCLSPSRTQDVPGEEGWADGGWDRTWLGAGAGQRSRCSCPLDQNLVCHPAHIPSGTHAVKGNKVNWSRLSQACKSLIRVWCR